MKVQVCANVFASRKLILIGSLVILQAKLARAIPNPFGIGHSISKVGENHQILSCKLTFLAWSHMVLVYMRAMLYLPSSTAPNYPPMLGCHALALHWNPKIRHKMDFGSF